MSTRRPILQKIREADVFAVPLLTNGWAVGVAARCSRKRDVKGVYGFFFGPRQDQVPSLSELNSLLPENSVHQEKFVARGIADGEWPIIGRFPRWNRDQWKLPLFVTGSGEVVAYNDDDIDVSVPTGQWLREKERTSLPRDGIAGGTAVQVALTRILDPDGAARIIRSESVGRPPIRCKEGDVVIIPLSAESWMAGVAARVTTSPVSQNLLLYCVGPPRRRLEWGAERVMRLRPTDAIKRLITSSGSIASGVWPIVGQVAPWVRSDWSLTEGVQRIPTTKKAWRITLSDDDPMHRISAEPIAESEAEHLTDVTFVPAEAVPAKLRNSMLTAG